jgi:metal-responsive CopG/Arc/MetJ family transcriptional regulator
MATDRQQIRSYVEAEIKEKFTRICKTENRSESNMVEYLVKRYIEEYETKHGREERKNNQGKSSSTKNG